MPAQTTAGTCDLCGTWDSSLLDGACPRCRARYQPKGVQGRAVADESPRADLLADGRLSARDLRVLLAARQHVDPKQGVFRAGYRVLSAATGLRVPRVCEAVGRLERLGWLQRQRVGRRVHLSMEGSACA